MRDGATLESSVGDWAGTGTLIYERQWQLCTDTWVNVARGRPAEATNALISNPASSAVDGIYETWWSSGQFAPQAITVDLGAPYPVDGIRLRTSQHPAGATAHTVTARGAAVGARPFELRRFDGHTADNQLWSTDSRPRSPLSSSPSSRLQAPPGSRGARSKRCRAAAASPISAARRTFPGRRTSERRSESLSGRRARGGRSRPSRPRRRRSRQRLRR